jgi:DNA-binding NarL/FixJ family response regulator
VTAAVETSYPTTGVPGAGNDVTVRLATSAHYRRPLMGMLYRLGIAVVIGAADSDALIIGAASVDEGIELCADLRTGQPRLLVAERFTSAGALKALRHDIRVMLSFCDVTPDRLLSAIESARHGDSRLSSDVVSALLRDGGTTSRTGGPIARPPVTVRQREVLTLMAAGHSNAAIAHLLGCSEHTVKNVIYDLMAKLRVRNRAHAVAYAVRTGLI